MVSGYRTRQRIPADAFVVLTIVFDSLPHDELPQAYAAAGVLTLGSLHEPFGIVCIEASMPLGLAVVCTNHPNQQQILQRGDFLNTKPFGAMSCALRSRSREEE